jgi:signal transduction histidine kinase
MISTERNPLESAREAALRMLSNLVLWLWTPVFGVGLVTRWSEPGTREIILLVLTALPFIGWLLRRPRWDTERRARFAIAGMMLISVVPMIMNSPRALSTMAVSIVLTLAMLFYGLRTSLAIIGVYLTAVMLNLVLTSLGVVHATPPEYLQPVVYKVITICVMFTGLWFSATVLQQTIQIYREAQADSERRQQALLEAQRESEALQRRELVSVVTTGMTHDLANVVQVLTATAELLESEPLHVDAQRVVSDLRRVGDETAMRLRTILSVGRDTANDGGPAQPEELFARLELVLGPLMGRKIAVTLDNEAFEPVAIDRGRLEQVLMNLALNARDAMPRGGSLRVHAFSHEGGVRFEVHDSGTGIDPTVQQSMWEPFYTTKPPGKGTGLGLAMVARILESAKGSVQVSSDVGVGTTISIWLPTA